MQQSIVIPVPVPVEVSRPRVPTPRANFSVTRELVRIRGGSDGCVACTEIHLGRPHVSQPHDQVCRQRLRSLISEETEGPTMSRGTK